MLVSATETRALGRALGGREGNEVSRAGKPERIFFFFFFFFCGFNPFTSPFWHTYIPKVPGDGSLPFNKRQLALAFLRLPLHGILEPQQPKQVWFLRGRGRKGVVLSSYSAPPLFLPRNARRPFAAGVRPCPEAPASTPCRWAIRPLLGLPNARRPPIDCLLPSSPLLVPSPQPKQLAEHLALAVVLLALARALAKARRRGKGGGDGGGGAGDRRHFEMQLAPGTHCGCFVVLPADLHQPLSPFFDASPPFTSRSTHFASLTSCRCPPPPPPAPLRHPLPPLRGRQPGAAGRRRSRSPAAPPATLLHVSNLTRNVHEGHVREIFSLYGVVKNAALVMDERVGLSKGAAFVEYADAPSAEKAVRALMGGGPRGRGRGGEQAVRARGGAI